MRVLHRFCIVAVLAGSATLGLAITATAADTTIRIGVMNDMSGPYADFQGPGSVLAAQMAVEDYGGKAAGHKVEVVFADHQNKPDIGATIARKWIDRDGVDSTAFRRGQRNRRTRLAPPRTARRW